MVQDLEHGEIDYWNFDAKALLKNAKMKLIMRISIHELMKIIYTLCRWIIYIKDKDWGHKNNFIGHWFWSRDKKKFLLLTQKS